MPRRVLWIAPNLNHYKARFLSRLAQRQELDLTVLSGEQVKEEGHRADERGPGFTNISLAVTKDRFQYSPAVYKRINGLLTANRFDVVLMPAEIKHALLIAYLFYSRSVFKYALVSYNHPLPEYTATPRSWLKSFVVRRLWRMYDRIILYTQAGMVRNLSDGSIARGKAWYANNTLDTTEIWKDFEFTVNKNENKTILFIGRLYRRKRIDILLEYFSHIRKMLPSTRLEIVGDGPEAGLVRDAARNDDHIHWDGAIIDEKLIRSHMLKSHIVFVPGHSGLSIVHAFCYGKPYATIASDTQPPEIEYLCDGKNGLLLKGEKISDCARIVELLTNRQFYEKNCREAYAMAKSLSVELWCDQMTDALEGNTSASPMVSK